MVTSLRMFHSTSKGTSYKDFVKYHQGDFLWHFLGDFMSMKMYFMRSLRKSQRKFPQRYFGKSKRKFPLEVPSEVL